MITYDEECAMCWLGHSHTLQEHDTARTMCTAWACGAPHPKTDHMSRTQAINWRNNETIKRMSGAVDVHWGFVHGEDNHFIQGRPTPHNYVFAIFR